MQKLPTCCSDVNDSADRKILIAQNDEYRQPSRSQKSQQYCAADYLLYTQCRKGSDEDYTDS